MSVRFFPSRNLGLCGISSNGTVSCCDLSECVCTSIECMFSYKNKSDNVASTIYCFATIKHLRPMLSIWKYFAKHPCFASLEKNVITFSKIIFIIKGSVSSVCCSLFDIYILFSIILKIHLMETNILFFHILEYKTALNI